eukprot:CAMPEP_0172530792 /NCGR_PEP_ID=MMETSP1067-20121228/4415_1 /TAXON_ID=265564 ORGANISM="Thalassiosira punctigera, Strain Tpunct2005C2" /NCGR_SAMPLE_ID=MMETSP1067 /ASSEMBLY_ACC=CAM_ASM_000444 /LENGTH=375 /DNA_ID=CAMNT_0013315061 /DNA_START=808 /DNA_END=1931 /DNA_ORIENTATION=+
MNSVIYHVQTLSIITLLEGALLGGIALGSLKMVIVKVNSTQLSDSKFTALQKNAVMNILEVLCLVYRTVKIPIPLSPWPIHFPGLDTVRQYVPDGEVGREIFWYPDLHNELNCFQGRNYESWMLQEGFPAYYLFTDPQKCCNLWFPANSNCPDSATAVNPEEDHAAFYADSYPSAGYFFPDFAVSSCGFGQDYPAWMGSDGYEKWYLFRKGDHCCKKYFPTARNCPYEDETQPELQDGNGYYWEKYQDNLSNGGVHPTIYNHTYYPDMHANTCVNGTDYPAWMASDRDFKRLYLFKNNPEDCCKNWFGAHAVEDCLKNIIQSEYIDFNSAEATDITVVNKTEEYLGMWYPVINRHKCVQDGSMPSWMLVEGYVEW